MQKGECEKMWRWRWNVEIKVVVMEVDKSDAKDFFE
jgi:hypothetical protein